MEEGGVGSDLISVLGIATRDWDVVLCVSYSLSTKRQWAPGGVDGGVVLYEP